MQPIFITYNETHINGCISFINEISTTLSQKEGIHVFIVILGSNSREVQVSVNASITKIDIPIISINRWLYSISMLATIIPDAFDNIFLLGFSPSFELSNCIKQIYSKSKLVHIVHDFMWATYVNGNINKFREIVCGQKTTYLNSIFQDGIGTFQLDDAIVCLSEDTYELLHELYQIPYEKLHLIKNGAKDSAHEYKRDNLIRDEFGISYDSFVFIFVGRLTQQKGFTLLLDAMRYIDDSLNYNVLCVGSTYSDNLTQIYPFLNYGKIRLMGTMEKEYLYKLYSMSDCGLILSQYEQCSYVGIEMKMFGLPIIATQNYGLRNMFNNGNALTVANDSVDIAEVMTQAIQHPDLIIPFRNKSRDDFNNKYIVDIMCSKYISLFNQLTSA